MKLNRIILCFGLLVLVNASAHAGGWVNGTVKNAAGSLEYKLWVPSGYRKEKPVPLVVMLHGCTQNAEALAALSGVNDLADKNDFLVVYPEQAATANPLKCWNWFDPKHQSRDAGEPSLIAQATQDARSTYNIDKARVYLVGISAGGAMAVVMAATYPDLFAGVGVIAGVEFKAATTVEGGLSAMKQGGPDPNQQGLLAFETIKKSGGLRIERIPLIAFQGTKDPYVNPMNADQLIAQWVETNDYLDDGKNNDSVSTKSPIEVRGTVPGGYSYTKYSYKNANGRLLMEKWIVEGLGHAWPGSTITNPFADAKGPNATAEIWRFFSETNSPSKVTGEND